jgi:outer membrane protein assembly factor BamB
VHRQLLGERGELASNELLAEMLQKTTAAETAAVRVVNEKQPAETDERPTPWVAALAIANHRVKPSSIVSIPADGPAAAIVQVDGAVYGLDAATGRLLWRRHLGFARRTSTQLIGKDVLVSDVAQDELLRLDAATGRLIWRQPLGEPFAPPLVVGDRGFAPADSGRLYVIDLQSGARTGYMQFAQSLRVTPAVDRNSQRLYLPGDHSSLYTVSLADLSCLGVYYFGHSEGAIDVSPAAVMDKVAVHENNGVETSRLRLMSLDDKGAIAGQVAEQRLKGLATSPPIVANRRLIATTDRGQIDVYEIGAGEGEDAIALVATRPATGSQPLARHAAISGRNIWVGDTQLTKFVVLPTGNRLPVEAIEDNFVGDTFDHPLALYVDTLIHARRPKDRAGVVVAATETGQGHTLWETDLAIPPVGAPVSDDANKAIAVATVEGYLFRFDEAAIRTRVEDQPLAAELMPAQLPALTAAVDLGQGRVAYCAAGSDRLLLYNPALGAQAAKWIQLESRLACAVTPLGDGFLVPTQIGQVFYLSSVDGSSLTTPFQPVLQPDTQWNYKPAGAVGDAGRQFVISDGRQKIYLVERVDQPQPHLKAVAEVDSGPYPIESQLFVLGGRAMAVAGGTRLVQFQLPTLQPAGESSFSAPVVWGPFRIGDTMLLATADGQLMSVSARGETSWKTATEHGDLAGAPLAQSGSVLIAYKNGILERRSLADGVSLGVEDLENPLATGAVPFLQRLVVAATDGTLLVVEQP